jgi:hypothetical protein
MTQNVLRVPACRALLPDNPAAPLQKRNPNALQDALIRDVNEDSKMSAFGALAVETGPFRHSQLVCDLVACGEKQTLIRGGAEWFGSV